MKKRTGLSIAGGILEIIAGVYWLGYALIAYGFYAWSGSSNFDYVQLIMPICFILFGIFACIGRKNSDLKTYATINILFIVWVLFKALYNNPSPMAIVYTILLCSFEIICLIIATFLFMFSKSEYDKWYTNQLKDYIATEPKENKTARYAMLVIFSSMLSIMILQVLSQYIRYAIAYGDLVNNNSATKLNGIGFITEIVYFIIAYILGLSYGLIKNKNKKQHKLTLNMIWCGFAYLLMFVISIYPFLVANTISLTTNLLWTIVGFIVAMAFIWATNKSQYHYELKKIIKNKKLDTTQGNEEKQ